MAGALDGKIAIITGAGSGMGASAARLFQAEGARLVLADVSGQQHGVAADLGDGVAACDVDVRRSDQVRAMVDFALEQFGGLDVLCNVAGASGALVPTADTPEENFDLMIDVNLRSVFLGMKYAIPHMIARGSGSIVSIASTAALIGTPELGTYAASKAGVVALTKVVAVEYGKRGIRANAICPGVINTPMMTAGVAENPGMVDYLKGLIPMGRIGQPEEIAQAMLFLASERSSYITGAVLPVEGGQTTA
jgi:NAD(P)-dependent dehydrogenase (short-subunit alcohol dehydrogenase family)